MKIFKGFKYLVMGIGLYKVGEVGYDIGTEVYFRHFKERQDLKQIYGDCYAVISDSASDLGYSYAAQLAKSRFNLILIAKNPEVLALQKQELQAQYGVQVSTFEYDPTKIGTGSGFDAIYNQIRGLDIGVLVNSAETYQLQRFDHLYTREIKDAINNNILAPTLILNTLIPKLLERNNRSCIINVGSALGDHPVGYLSLYSATKAFNNTLSRALSQEFKERIDIITSLPGHTETRAYKAIFDGRINEESSYFTKLAQAFRNTFIISSPEDSAEATLGLVDSKNEIPGTKKHVLYHLFQRSLPYVSWRGDAFSRLYQEFGERRTSNIPPWTEVVEPVEAPKVVEKVKVKEVEVPVPVVVVQKEIVEVPVVIEKIVAAVPRVYSQPDIPVDITKTLSNDFLLQFIAK